jgi:NDP-sugar pyrophosphorylase family protein
MIVIPMAGLSSRFFKAGYDRPKYMLYAHGKSLFDYSVESFKAYFLTHSFLFIVRDVFETQDFVKERARLLGIKNFHVVSLNDNTRGQAETVALGIKTWKEKTGNDLDESLTIFNIDTFRKNFTFPDLSALGDGYLEVFKGDGENWSFAKPMSSDSSRVIETSEKRAISDLCSTGLYYFSSIKSYLEAFDAYLKLPKEKWEKGELYIAPLYNFLIDKGFKIHYHCIQRSDVIFCGIPEEYQIFLNSLVKKM